MLNGVSNAPVDLLRLPNNNVIYIDPAMMRHFGTGGASALDRKKCSYRLADQSNNGSWDLFRSQDCDSSPDPRAIHFQDLKGSWSELLALESVSLHRARRYHNEEEQRMVNVANDRATDLAIRSTVHNIAVGTWLPLGMGSDYSNALRRRLALVMEDEEQMLLLGSWAVPYVNLAVEGESLRRHAALWLKALWVASHADLGAIQEQMRECKALSEPSPKCNEDLADKVFGLDGLFLRRYLAKGGGPAGQDLIAVHQYWMARIAKELGMPEAGAWMKEARTALDKNKTPEVVELRKRYKK
jgi:hypothetical protein